MNTLIIGASSRLGQCIAERCAKARHNLFLISSDPQDLEPLQKDLTLRFNVKVSLLATDLRECDTKQLKIAIHKAFPVISNIFYIAGVGYVEKDSGSISNEMLDELVNVNYISPIKIINSFLPELEKQDNAHIIGISSIAASRPRKINSIYAASKNGLEFYLGTLRHYLSDRKCKVQYYRLGYMASRLSDDKKLSLFPVSQPEEIADQIIKGLGKSHFRAYLPGWWSWVMIIYQLLPWPIYKRLSF